MKRKIWSITVVVTAVLLACCIASAKAQSLFKDPELVFSAPEGANPGEFGRLDPKPEGEPRYPSDFTIDSKGNFCIQDDVNRRIQKFNRDGSFILSWRPPREGGWIQVGASLEVDSQDNIYVLTDHDEGLRGWKLDNQAKFVSHFEVEFGSGIELWLRVNSKGNIFISSGRRSLFLNKAGKTVLRRGGVRRIYTSGFSDYIFLENFGVQGKRWPSFERHAQIPEKGISGLSTSINKQGSSYGVMSAINGQGNLFILKVEGRSRIMGFYGRGGEYLGKVPDCPKETQPRPNGGDDFVTDADGNLYQLQLFHTQIGRKTAEGWVKIWKWDRIK